MSFRTSIVLAAALVALGSLQEADARAPTAARLRQAPDDPQAYLIDGRYQRGTERLARMRRRGELPDRIIAGPCTYDLAGDIGVAYYVKTCR